MRASVISDMDGGSEYQGVNLEPQNWSGHLFYSLIRALNWHPLQGVVGKDEGPPST